MYKKLILIILFSAVPITVSAGSCDQMSAELESLKESHLALEEKLLALNLQYLKDIEALKSRPMHMQAKYTAEQKIYFDYELAFGKTSTELEQVRFKIRNLLPEFEACSEREYNEGMARIAEEEKKILREAEERRLAEQREKEISNALQSCNTAFFETMTNEEKMRTYNERTACKQVNVSTESNILETKHEVTEVVPAVAPVQVEKPTQVSSRVVPEDIPLPVAEQKMNDDSGVIDQETEAISRTEEATTTDEITVTSEELEAMVQERIESELKQAEPEPEPKPSVFKRVVNFLFGWLW